MSKSKSKRLAVQQGDCDVVAVYATVDDLMRGLDEPTRPDGMQVRDRIPSEDTYLVEEADVYMDHLEQRLAAALDVMHDALRRANHAEQRCRELEAENKRLVHQIFEMTDPNKAQLEEKP